MTIHLKIDGMHCAGCATAVRRVLEAEPSVSRASVDLESGRADVEAGPAVDEARLILAVEDAGYEARVVA